jgi:DNA-directed RNA polymerase
MSKKAYQAHREWEASEKARIKSEENRAKQIKRSGLSSTKTSQALIDNIIAGVVAEIERHVEKEYAKRRLNEREEWLPHVADVHFAIVAEAALIVCLDAAGRAATYNSVLVQAGRALHMAKFVAAMSKNRQGLRMLKQMEARAKKRNTKYADRNEYMANFAKRHGFSDWDDWDEALYRKVGSFMIDVVQLGSEIIEISHVETKGAPKGVMYITLTQKAKDWMKDEDFRLDQLASIYGPMTCVPNPWPSQTGPYLDKRAMGMVPMIKKMWSPEQKRDVDAAVEDGSLDRPIQALNIVQSVPYATNQYVLDAVNWVKDNDLGHQVEDFPDLEPDPEVERIDAKVWRKFSAEQKADWYTKRDEQAKSKVEAGASLSCLNTNTGEAAEMVKCEYFYLPHQFDRRGRIYHTSTFGHHNTDYVRALFLFANKTKIGEEGEPYLDLQIANSWGNGEDKKSLDDRVAWVEKNEDMILAVGEDFSVNFDDWSKADNPFQFLAACREKYNYRKHGKDYESGLPIGLDATQSGVQHYATAIRHKENGEMVNLLPSLPSDEPNDLYLYVMHKAEEMMSSDIASIETWLVQNPDASPEVIEKKERDLKAAKDMIAWGGLNRKIIKSPCMTYCYSSRQFGFMVTLRKKYFKDITKKLKAGRLTHPVTGETVTSHPFGKDRGFGASIYFGGLFERAIESVVQSALIGQDFIQKCVANLAAHDRHFAFTTPLGFPMHQFYRVEAEDAQRPRVYLTDRKTKVRKKGAKASVTVYTDDIKMPQSVNASSPNVIHAMDACHLQMTVLRFAAFGCTDIMVVHDSFSTTIGNAKELSRCVREAFIELYDGYDLYADILKQSRERHPDPDNIKTQSELDEIDFLIATQDDKAVVRQLTKDRKVIERRIAVWPEVPKHGDLNLMGILQSQYAFS